MPLLCEAEHDAMLAHFVYKHHLNSSGPYSGSTRVCRAVSPALFSSSSCSTMNEPSTQNSVL